MLRVRVTLEEPDVLRLSLAGPGASVLPGAAEIRAGRKLLGLSRFTGGSRVNDVSD